MAVLLASLVAWVVFRAMGGARSRVVGDGAGFGGSRARGDVCADRQRAVHEHEA